MARFDKYEPLAGGFRAPLGYAVLAADLGKVIGVGISASGTAEVGVSDSGVVGVVCPNSLLNVGDTIDIMTSGEIVESGVTTFGTPGDILYAHASTGVLSTTNTGARVGHLVQAWRLIVRVQPIES